ncbi:MAG: hypothetical protein ACXABY_25435 [Candidatus Thorarchaeota archaeon]|jgi:hypothetical protein
MRDINKLNVLTNPLNYGETVMLDGFEMRVDQTMGGLWFLYHVDRPAMCMADSMVDFIARILDANNQSIK